MVLQELGGGGYDDVQATAPSNPKIGDTWLDTSTDNGVGKIYADFGGGGAEWHTLPMQRELQEGGTRELLLLLQDRPVPEIPDPINAQSTSSVVLTGADDYQIDNGINNTGFETGDLLHWSGDTSAFTVTSGSKSINGYSALSEKDGDAGQTGFWLIQQSNQQAVSSNYIEFEVSGEVSGNSSHALVVDPRDGSGTSIAGMRIGIGSDYPNQNTGSYYIPNTGNPVTLRFEFDYGAQTYDILEDGVVQESGLSFSNNVQDLQTVEVGHYVGVNSGTSWLSYDDFVVDGWGETSGYVTDQFSAPTTSPADFSQWDSIRAQDVDVGGSTSPNPVEFDILDSSDAVLTSSRIPVGEIADSAFRFRGREYSEDAAADGQSQFTIPETGAGGHYGFSIFSVVTVEQNGSVLDEADWEFDGTDTVTIDTSTVTISAGDTITISYDFDVFDSTLKPRAHLSRESTSETPPSISHFRYEYVI